MLVPTLFARDTTSRMATTIGANRAVDELTVHSIPCSVTHNGPAPVSTYFRPGDAAAANDTAANENMMEVWG